MSRLEQGLGAQCFRSDHSLDLWGGVQEKFPTTKIQKEKSTDVVKGEAAWTPDKSLITAFNTWNSKQGLTQNFT